MLLNTLPVALRRIRDRIETGQRLSAADGEVLLDPETELHAVGELADLVRRGKNGNLAYYNLNAHLNPTNICVYRCPLCAYSCDAGDAKAYVLSDEEILARAQEAVRDGCTELHIVGGIHPDKPFAWYRGILAMLHAAWPSLHLKAFTAVEIARFAELTGESIRRVLEDLIEAGLGSLPGGGAEIFAPEVRARIAPGKPDAQTWLDVHRTAHRLELSSNATMLYGHVEKSEHLIDHLLRLRGLQDETGGFQAFVPLAFHPAGTRLAHLSGPSASTDLRIMAVSRLLLDNFPHIKAYWISLGVGMAQVALGYGADDLDGTVRQERIHHDAGSTAPQVLSVDELRGLISETGRQPVERDTLYRHVRRDGVQWTVDQ